MKKLLLIILFMLIGLEALGQTATFNRKYYTTNGAKLTGRTIALCPTTSVFPADTIKAVENPALSGNYVFTGVADGDYNVYINGVLEETLYIPASRLSDAADIVDSLTNAGWTANQITTFLSAIKVSGENKVSLSGIDSSSSGGQVVVTDANGVPTYKTMSGDIIYNSNLAEFKLSNIRMTGIKNLFDSSKVTTGYYVASGSGVLTSNASYSASDYIEVLPSTDYKRVLSTQMAFFDSSKTYISGSSSAQFTTPANCRFVRLSVTNAHLGTEQLELGTVSTDYVKYYPTVKDANFNDIAIKYILNPVILEDTNNIITPKSYVDSLHNSDTLRYAQIEVGRNLFNKNASDVTLGKYVDYTTGNLSTNASYNTTGYIPVSESSVYTMSYKHAIAWYNSSKTYISGSASSDANKTQTSPAGAAYLRATVITTVWNTFIVNEGSEQLAYKDYEFVLSNNLPDSSVHEYNLSTSLTRLLVMDNEVLTPAKQYLLKGYENTIYYEAISERYLPDMFFTRFGGQFYNYSSYARVNSPTSTSAVTISMYNLNFDVISTDSFTPVLGDSTTPTTAKTVNVIGDSFTYNSAYLKRARALCPNLTFDGMREPYGDTAIAVEGRGGWTLNLYATRKYGDTGGTTTFSPLINVADPYTYYGNTTFWEAVKAGSTDYEIAGFSEIATEIGFEATGYLTSPSTNDVMYDNDLGGYYKWNGSSWASLSADSLTWSFNYAKYRSTWNVTQPDFVLIQLGINDFRDLTNPAAAEAAFTTWTTLMDSLIASIHADNASAKIGILIPNSVMGQVDNTSNYFVKKQNANMYQVRKSLIAEYDGREGELIYLVDTGSSVDPYYGYSKDSEEPFEDYVGSDTRAVDNNPPHPSTYGYYQMGVKLAAFIQAVR